VALGSGLHDYPSRLAIHGPSGDGFCHQNCPHQDESLKALMGHCPYLAYSIPLMTSVCALLSVLNGPYIFMLLSG